MSNLLKLLPRGSSPLPRLAARFFMIYKLLLRFFHSFIFPPHSCGSSINFQLANNKLIAHRHRQRDYKKNKQTNTHNENLLVSLGATVCGLRRRPRSVDLETFWPLVFTMTNIFQFACRRFRSLFICLSPSPSSSAALLRLYRVSISSLSFHQ